MHVDGTVYYINFGAKLWRLGCIVQTLPSKVRTVELAPPDGSTINISGALSLNDPGEVAIHDLKGSGARTKDIDASVFNNLRGGEDLQIAADLLEWLKDGWGPASDDRHFYPIELGRTNNLDPLTISYSAISPLRSPTAPFLKIMFIGTLMQRS